jgi:hypothetical protein
MAATIGRKEKTFTSFYNRRDVGAAVRGQLVATDKDRWPDCRQARERVARRRSTRLTLLRKFSRAVFFVVDINLWLLPYRHGAVNSPRFHYIQFIEQRGRCFNKSLRCIVLLLALWTARHIIRAVISNRIMRPLAPRLSAK